MKGATPDHPSGNQGKESFSLIQPCSHELLLDFGTFVSAVGVHDQMHLLVLGELPLQVVEEPYELTAAGRYRSPCH